MSWAQRIVNIAAGLGALLSCVLLIASPGSGYVFVSALLCTSLWFYGLRMLGYYLTMAHHMVGGQAILILGVILFDLACFATSLTDVPRAFVMVYLLCINAFSGATSVFKALQERQAAAPRWALTLVHGLFNLALAASCLIFRNSEVVIVYIFCVSLAFTAMRRLTAAFRRTAIIYIP